MGINLIWKRCQLVMTCWLLIAVGCLETLADDYPECYVHFRESVRQLETAIGKDEASLKDYRRLERRLRAMLTVVDTYRRFITDKQVKTMSEDEAREFTTFSTLHTTLSTLLRRVQENKFACANEMHNEERLNRAQLTVAQKELIEIDQLNYKEWTNENVLPELIAKYRNFITRHNSSIPEVLRAFQGAMIASMRQYDLFAVSEAEKGVVATEIEKLIDDFYRYCSDSDYDDIMAVAMPQLVGDRYFFPRIFTDEVAFIIGEYPFYQNAKQIDDCNAAILLSYSELTRAHFRAIFKNMVRKKLIADTHAEYDKLIRTILTAGNRCGEFTLAVVMNSWVGDSLQIEPLFWRQHFIPFMAIANKYGKYSSRTVLFCRLIDNAMRLKLRLLYEESKNTKDKATIAIALAQAGDSWGAEAMVAALADDNPSLDVLQGLRYFYPLRSFATDSQEIDWLPLLEKTHSRHPSGKLGLLLKQEINTLRALNVHIGKSSNKQTNFAK